MTGVAVQHSGTARGAYPSSPVQADPYPRVVRSGRYVPPFKPYVWRGMAENQSGQSVERVLVQGDPIG